jgi:UDP-N-acetylglucosamine 4-epimerase
VIKSALLKRKRHLTITDPIYPDYQEGDVKYSRANIDKASEVLGYAPKFRIAHGLEKNDGLVY